LGAQDVERIRTLIWCDPPGVIVAPHNLATAAPKRAEFGSRHRSRIEQRRNHIPISSILEVIADRIEVAKWPRAKMVATVRGQEVIE
jgi:hypothetical protein